MSQAAKETQQDGIKNKCNSDYKTIHSHNRQKKTKKKYQEQMKKKCQNNVTPTIQQFTVSIETKKEQELFRFQNLQCSNAINNANHYWYNMNYN